MMFISDKKAIINTMGLRYIIKKDHSWGHKTSYSLELSYKGHEKSFDYELEEDRNAMFDKILIVLKLQKKAT